MVEISQEQIHKEKKELMRRYKQLLIFATIVAIFVTSSMIVGGRDGKNTELNNKVDLHNNTIRNDFWTEVANFLEK